MSSIVKGKVENSSRDRTPGKMSPIIDKSSQSAETGDNSVQTPKQQQPASKPGCENEKEMFGDPGLIAQLLKLVKTPQRRETGSAMSGRRSQTERSLSRGDRPASQADRPASQADRPASKADRPASQADGPASQADRAASQADRPASQAERSASRTERLARQADRTRPEGPATRNRAVGQFRTPTPDVSASRVESPVFIPTRIHVDEVSPHFSC